MLGARPPPRIDRVTVGATGGVIGLTECPGVRGLFALAGPRRRDLATDLEAIAAFGAEALATLMQGNELASLGVPADAFAAAAGGAGLDWHHLPIVDGAAPDHDFEARWTDAGPRLRGILMRGGTVVVHCRAGLGRSGTVAARLLVELGAEPGDAIARVRAARPGAIEAPAQERYVEACRAPSGS